MSENDELYEPLSDLLQAAGKDNLPGEWVPYLRSDFYATAVAMWRATVGSYLEEDITQCARRLRVKWGETGRVRAAEQLARKLIATSVAKRPKLTKSTSVRIPAEFKRAKKSVVPKKAAIPLVEAAVVKKPHVPELKKLSVEPVVRRESDSDVCGYGRPGSKSVGKAISVFRSNIVKAAPGAAPPDLGRVRHVASQMHPNERSKIVRSNMEEEATQVQGSYPNSEELQNTFRSMKLLTASERKGLLEGVPRVFSVLFDYWINKGEWNQPWQLEDRLKLIPSVMFYNLRLAVMASLHKGADKQMLSQADESVTKSNSLILEITDDEIPSKCGSIEGDGEKIFTALKANAVEVTQPVPRREIALVLRDKVNVMPAKPPPKVKCDRGKVENRHLLSKWLHNMSSPLQNIEHEVVNLSDDASKLTDSEEVTMRKRADRVRVPMNPRRSIKSEPLRLKFGDFTIRGLHDASVATPVTRCVYIGDLLGLYKCLVAHGCKANIVLTAGFKLMLAFCPLARPLPKKVIALMRNSIQSVLHSPKYLQRREVLYKEASKFVANVPEGPIREHVRNNILTTGLSPIKQLQTVLIVSSGVLHPLETSVLINFQMYDKYVQIVLGCLTDPTFRSNAGGGAIPYEERTPQNQLATWDNRKQVKTVQPKVVKPRKQILTVSEEEEDSVQLETESDDIDVTSEDSMEVPLFHRVSDELTDLKLHRGATAFTGLSVLEPRGLDPLDWTLRSLSNAVDIIEEEEGVSLKSSTLNQLKALALHQSARIAELRGVGTSAVDTLARVTDREGLLDYFSTRLKSTVTHPELQRWIISADLDERERPSGTRKLLSVLFEGLIKRSAEEAWERLEKDAALNRKRKRRGRNRRGKASPNGERANMEMREPPAKKVRTIASSDSEHEVIVNISDEEWDWAHDFSNIGEQRNAPSKWMRKNDSVDKNRVLPK